jgi:hypothetical protein
VTRRLMVAYWIEGIPHVDEWHYHGAQVGNDLAARIVRLLDDGALQVTVREWDARLDRPRVAVGTFDEERRSG